MNRAVPVWDAAAWSFPVWNAAAWGFPAWDAAVWGFPAWVAAVRSFPARFVPAWNARLSPCIEGILPENTAQSSIAIITLLHLILVPPFNPMVCCVSVIRDISWFKVHQPIYHFILLPIRRITAHAQEQPCTGSIVLYPIDERTVQNHICLQFLFRYEDTSFF